MKAILRMAAVALAWVLSLMRAISRPEDGQPAQSQRPNIVFILVDNLGYGELGVYGGGVLRGAPTPRIDRLATEGFRLTNFNVEAQCTPTRSALMTGRFSFRSGTYAVPMGGQHEGLTQWEVTVAQLLSRQGYATGMWGKWHLGREEGRLPHRRGFDEWFGIPRTYDEAMWPAQTQSNGLWPAVGAKQGWSPEIAPLEPIYEAHKGANARQVGELTLETRRTMETEITSRAIAFIERNAAAGKLFFAYVSSSMVHMPTIPGPGFAGKTGNGDWADSLAEMDYRTGEILDAIKQAGIEDNTIVVFASDNGPEGTDPWEGDSGLWRGTYFTAMGGSLRAPFIIRWPGKIPAGRVSNEIVHVVDMFPTLAHVAGAEVPKDRAIDGVDQMDFFLGKQEKSNREGFPVYVADKLYAVKWRNWKMHLIWQVNMYDPPQVLAGPWIFNLLTDIKEERNVSVKETWVIVPMGKILTDWEASLKKYPPIPMGTPDPYKPK
ncbi:arylsulfatase [Dyella sp. C9]|uniref:arylsulfatase n=1 Tax=Dyella sp. C9 TaxID=2202154 RepID=UPI0018E55DAD|nr:arylsulfatase [Dyella sp. C9]